VKVAGVPYRSVWREADRVAIIDQTRLPFEFHTLRLSDCDEIAHSIRSMQVRGAPLIGATAAFGIALAMSADASDVNLQRAAELLGDTRPTAVNLRWAINRMTRLLQVAVPAARTDVAWTEAGKIADEDIALNLSIGRHGLAVMRSIADKKGKVNVLTHCNAGWLATGAWGTALAPVYAAHAQGIALHVWVDETRPRNQGARLTAWELAQAGVPHTLIADNAAGHLMQRGEVDLCLVGSDRCTAQGDVCNKIGTYQKALAAADNGVSFYVALPLSTIDWTLHDGLAGIPIETRAAEELLVMEGVDDSGETRRLRGTMQGTPALNPAFDVTPARLVTGLLCEHGLYRADAAELQALRAVAARAPARV